MSSASLKVTEPSMEDILASIRRIIADDQEAMDSGEAFEPMSAPIVSSPLKTVLDLTERHVQPLRSESGLAGDGFSQVKNFAADDGAQDFGEGLLSTLLGKDPVSESAAPQVQAQVVSTNTLLSAQASASIAGSFDKLSSTLMPSRSQALEDLMKEMLRPMLKTWLDQNLPALVERLVQAEIERIACGKR
jgi:cell pole-organizing protein PopZ